MNINDVKIIKKLGHGYKGTVYLVKYKNKEYAFKIEKILENLLKQSGNKELFSGVKTKENTEKNISKSLIRRYFPKEYTEINFSIKFANKYNNQFIKLYNYNIINNCTHKQKINVPLKRLHNNIVNKIKKLRKSKYCFIRLYSLVDTTLDKIKNKLSIKQIYSMLIQLSYINYLLKKNNYLYGDMNLYNIGVVKTNKKYIKILNKKIPTFGYIFKLIDFGTVSKYKNKEYFYELTQVISYYLIDYTKLYNKIEYNNNNIIKKILKLNEYKLLSKYTNNNELKYILFTIIYPEKYQKIIFKNKFNKIIYPKLRCNIEDIIYLIKNNNKINNIINYFLDKINFII